MAIHKTCPQNKISNVSCHRECLATGMPGADSCALMQGIDSVMPQPLQMDEPFGITVIPVSLLQDCAILYWSLKSIDSCPDPCRRRT